MDRRLFPIFISILLISTSSITPKADDGNIIYVDDDNISGPWDGSKEYPYQHIQDAIDNASNGDTIFVYSGVYYECIIIDKDVSLIGEDRDTTIIDGNRCDDVVTIESNGVDISNFTILHSGFLDAGVHMNHSSNIVISNCKILDGSGVGISIDSSHDNIIHDCNLSSNEWEGIYIDSSYNNIIYNCSIISNHWGGIISDYSNSVVIDNCIISSNTFCGIRFSHSINANIQRCNISNNDRLGIIFYSSNRNSISDCIFFKDSLIIQGNSLSEYTHIIENNSINGKSLLYYINKKDMVLDDLDVNEIILVNCNNFSIKNIDISNTSMGIEVVYSSNIDISNCSILNSYDGIDILYSNYSSISNCVISSDTPFIFPFDEYGIGISYSNNNTIHDCTVSKNEICGIDVVFSNNNEIYRCNIFSNGRGVEFTNSDNSDIYYSNIHSNKYEGISISSASYNTTVYSCNISNNCYGIMVSSSKSKILNNNFIDNEIHASFLNSLFNFWSQNYWDNEIWPLPKLIVGFMYYEFGVDIFIPWVNFDWHPAREPYDI